MRKLLVALVVLLALLVVGDRVAARVADGVLASQLRSELGTRPTVHVRGFPFLTQALRGSYDDIDVSAGRVDEGVVVLSSFTASLSGAQVPLSDALHRSVTSVPVRRLQATGLVGYDAVQAALGERGVQVAYDPEGVRVTGSVRVLGRTVQATAVSDLRLEDDALVLTARRVEVAGAVVTGSVADAVSQGLDLRVPLRDLPYGVRLSQVSAGPGGLTVSGSAADVVLRP